MCPNPTTTKMNKSPKRVGRIQKIERSGNGNKYVPGLSLFWWQRTHLDHWPQIMHSVWCHVFGFLRIEMHPFSVTQEGKRYLFRWDLNDESIYTILLRAGRRERHSRVSCEKCFCLFSFCFPFHFLLSTLIAIWGEEVLHRQYCRFIVCILLSIKHIDLLAFILLSILK